MSNITLNIVEPGSPTPDPVVPNTGLFTHGIGGPEATILGIVTAVVILAAVIAVLYYRNKKQGKSISLKYKKASFVGLASLAVVISIGTVASLLRLGASAAEGEDGLTLDVSSEDLTIEVGDGPVFAVLPVELTVEEATQAGYTLTAYTDNTDLVSTTDSSKVIPMVAADEGELTTLTDNTYGLALVEPESQAEEVYIALSTDADAPTFITDKDHKATEAGDTTIIYYGFYITPDVPYGTYEGSDIYYDVEENYITDLSFDGNGSDGGTAMEGMTLLAGDTITLPENTFAKEGYNFTGWNTAADGTGKAYTDGAEYTAVEGEFAEVILYAQWEELCPANSICYKANGANTGENDPKMSNQSASSSADTTLWASNFKYDTNGDGGNDYGFAGWSTDKNAASKINNTGDDKPTIYGPNQTITTGDLSEEGMKLYAVWIASANENSTLQGFTCPSNTDMPVGNVMALKDTRDNQVYTVAKLADGNCWMAENLRLADTHKENGQTVATTISSSNTHNPASGFTALATSSNSWCNSWNVSCFDQSYLNNDNTASVVANMAQTDSNIYSYGNYYNWYSATTGNGKFETDRDVIAAGDICPIGWILPYGGTRTSEKGGNTSGGFYYLNDAVNNGGTDAAASNKMRSFPNNFVYSGDWYGSSARSRGESGNYWSSTANYTGGSFYFYFLSYSVSPGKGSNGKSNGYSVRCVASVQ